MASIPPLGRTPAKSTPSSTPSKYIPREGRRGTIVGNTFRCYGDLDGLIFTSSKDGRQYICCPRWNYNRSANKPSCEFYLWCDDATEHVGPFDNKTEAGLTPFANVPGPTSKQAAYRAEMNQARLKPPYTDLRAGGTPAGSSVCPGSAVWAMQSTSRDQPSPSLMRQKRNAPAEDEDDISRNQAPLSKKRLSESSFRGPPLGPGQFSGAPTSHHAAPSPFGSSAPDAAPSPFVSSPREGTHSPRPVQRNGSSFNSREMARTILKHMPVNARTMGEMDDMLDGFDDRARGIEETNERMTKQIGALESELKEVHARNNDLYEDNTKLKNEIEDLRHFKMAAQESLENEKANADEKMEDIRKEVESFAQGLLGKISGIQRKNAEGA
ncbi:hypothetical protein QBC39DRAFT_65344 [Podospora conica]|nr:hypothetical protein QBC39DRAFT_65344 [Schizothecium conicum]